MIPLPHIAGQTIAILGLGKSGMAAARAISASGGHVVVMDDNEASLRAAMAEGFSPAAGPDMLAGVDQLLLAPGIPHTHPAPHPLVTQAREKAIPLTSDIELLFQALDTQTRVIGITGTNGKSTTTALAGHVLGACGVPVAVGGNLGDAALGLDMPAGAGASFVLELSSYQIDITATPALDAAILLNITSDHLDRHGGMDGYVAAKARIFDLLRPGGVAIIGVDDAWCAGIAGQVEATGGQVIRISADRPETGTDGIDLTGLPRLAGRHNHQNIAAAMQIARAIGLDEGDATRAVASFPGLAHRQQLVAEIGQLRFINDSKATNAEAAGKALGAYDNIYWIVGGRPKETGLDGLEDMMSRVRHSFLIGEAETAFATWLDGRASFTACTTLDRAVAEATRMALADMASADQAKNVGAKTILLSPACASFDQFKSFEARGEAFITLVRAIEQRMSGGALSGASRKRNGGAA